MNILLIAVAFFVGVAFGFIITAIRIDRKPSGILHIKETEDKDYYTIEITDDFDEIPNKKQIVLLVKTSRENHTL